MKPHLLPCFLVSIVSCALPIACRTTSSEVSDHRGFTELTRGYDSGIEKHGLVVARTEAEWEALWAEHTSRVVFKVDRPHVDWTRDMVVGVLLGERRTGGFGVRIERVSTSDGKRFVEAVESRPLDAAFVPQVVTHPYDFALVPRSTLPVELRLH